jgi:membrane-bound lytic murein transglycosylase B
MPFFFKKFLFSVFIFTISVNFSFPTFANDDFEIWLDSFKKQSQKKGISKKTLDIAFKNVRFIEKVLVYDRKQPEFYEDTVTYVNKRANKSRARIASKLYKENESLFLDVEEKFLVEKKILLSLWGIETNFGKHVGKMDIISSLATLSFDQRRSEYFSKELFTVLQLIENNLINPEKLFGSWAGAFGNFQFMPSTIKNYAIDYDNNNKIELKDSLHDALASAANYINKIGWKKGEPCFLRVNLNDNISKKYINSSARNISNRLKVSQWGKKGVNGFDGSKLTNKVNPDLKAALIIPDGKPNTPAFLVFHNYERILQWNRSLRFGISVCTLAKKIKI